MSTPADSNARHENLAAEELARRMMPIIRRIAARLARRLPRHVRIDDLIGAGCQGLMAAIARYDATRAAEFESYAEVRIRGAMLDELRAWDPLTRDQRIRCKRILAANRELERRLGRSPAADEVASELGITLETYWAWQSATARWSHALVEGDDGADPVAQLSDTRTEASDDRLSRREREDAVRAAIDALPPRLRHILHLHYVDGLTLRHIGAELGITESRVCQLEADALRRLRALCQESDTTACAA
jgi:RNA polymerase sigma factor for flagellar operon FliA